MALSLLLSLVHSQIVATNIAQSGGVVKCKRRRYSNTSQNSGRQGELRRRKKFVKYELNLVLFCVRVSNIVKIFK